MVDGELPSNLIKGRVKKHGFFVLFDWLSIVILCRLYGKFHALAAKTW